MNCLHQHSASALLQHTEKCEDTFAGGRASPISNDYRVLDAEDPQVSAASQWRSILTDPANGSPLRPAGPDVGFYTQAIRDWQQDFPGRSPRGLILGATPALYHLAWPDVDDVYAVDQSKEVLQYVWPGRPDRGICCSWLSLDLPSASIDVVACDGGLHLLDWPSGQSELARKLALLVKPGGRVAMRLFLPPPQKETPLYVLQDLLAGRVPNLGHLKVRMGCALMRSPELGVARHEVWEYLRNVAGDRGWIGMAQQIGWDPQALAAIDSYRNCQVRYYYTDINSVQETFMANVGGAFSVAAIHRPSYAMGEFFPTVVFKRN